MKSFIVCLESGEYVQMRNSLIILTKVLPFYPKLIGFCSALEKRVEKIKMTEKDKKQDIYTLASVYLGQLKQRKTNMVDEGKFHLKETQMASAKLDMKQSLTTPSALLPSLDSKFKQPNLIAKPQTAPGASFATKQIIDVLKANSGSGSGGSLPHSIITSNASVKSQNSATGASNPASIVTTSSSAPSNSQKSAENSSALQASNSTAAKINSSVNKTQTSSNNCKILNICFSCKLNKICKF